jgi:hypothetical protein
MFTISLFSSDLKSGCCITRHSTALYVFEMPLNQSTFLTREFEMGVILNSGHEQPLTNTCVTAVVAVSNFGRTRSDWFYAICIFEKIRAGKGWIGFMLFVYFKLFRTDKG